MKTTHFRKALIAAVAAAPLTAAFATNGMNMEGYGPIATGMGGASQAADTGTAGMAQNPATLSLMGQGSRIDAALGLLGPKVSASHPMAGTADSEANSFLMPALGYARRDGALVYGIGMMAQGGMGTEYSATSFLAAPMGPNSATGEVARSELGVGKVIVPVSYQVNNKLAVGATVDFMWAGLDLMMAAPLADLGPMASGTMMTGIGSMIAGGMIDPNTAWARINFSDDNKNTGAAKSTGYAAKLGAVYQVSETVTVGGSYQLKSSLGDMKTSAGGATMKVGDATSGTVMTDTGTMTVIDFQWPAMASLGASWKATPSLLVAADVKSIGWAEVMKDFKMRYDSTTNPGANLSITMPQNWKDQTVFNLGVAYMANDKLTLRAGVNLADNPVPDDTVNPLFPATVKSHYTAGLGYKFSATSEFNMSYVVAPKVTVTSPNGMEISHAQSNMQLMYTHRY